MKTIINQYNVYLNNGDVFTLCASNIHGAQAQVANLAGHVFRIERVYKTGKRAVCPW